MHKQSFGFCEFQKNKYEHCNMFDGESKIIKKLFNRLVSAHLVETTIQNTMYCFSFVLKTK